MSDYKSYLTSTRHHQNRGQIRSRYVHQDILSLDGFKRAKEEICSWDLYQHTPLQLLSDIANDSSVS